LIKEEIMTTHAFDWLSMIGLADFQESARADAESYADTYYENFAGVRDEEPFRAFIELGAVEFALAPLYHNPIRTGQGIILGNVQQPPPGFPVSVSDRHVAYAIFKTDCGPFFEHSWKTPNEITLWDVFTFAGDMSKVELMGFANDVNTLANPDRMQALIDDLGRRYIEAGLGYPIVESGLLDAQGLIWFAKLAVLRGEDYMNVRGWRFTDRFG